MTSCCKQALVLGVLLLTTVSCGYTTQSSLDPQYRTIHVAPFENETRQYGLQAPLTNAITRKFIADGRLRVAGPDAADLILEGVLTRYNLRGLTFDENDRVTQFRTIISARVRLTDTHTGDVLWEADRVDGQTTLYTQAVGQSADGLRGNTEVFVTPVRSFTSSEENRGAGEALEQLATDIFYRTIEPW